MADNFQNIRNGVNVGQFASDPANGVGGDIYYNTATGNFRIFQNDSWDNIIQSGSSAFAGYTSSPVVTNSSSITSPTFETFDNSPAFTFTPTISGIYKIYCSCIVNAQADVAGIIRVYNTSGSATLLYESQGAFYTTGSNEVWTVAIQSTYNLTAGITYQFDIQGYQSQGTTGIQLVGEITGSVANAFYMFAEGIGLTTGALTNFYISDVIGVGSLGVTGGYVEGPGTPSFTFTPTVGGTYKVYGNIQASYLSGGPVCTFRINNTSANATLLAESGGYWYANDLQTFTTVPIIAIYNLSAGVEYVFDYQVNVGGSGSASFGSEGETAYLFAELVAPLIGSGAPSTDISESSGSFSTGSGSPVDVTNLTATIVSAGVLPVELYLQSDGSGNPSFVGQTENSGSFGNVTYYFLRNGTVIGTYLQEIATTPAGSYLYLPSTSVRFTDFNPPAGTNVYTVQIAAGSVVGAVVSFCVLVAQEVGGGGGGAGVISVGLADASDTPIFEISESPVTGTGVLTETLIAQSAKTALMGPVSGGSAQPTFRNIEASDLPPISGSNAFAVYTSSQVTTTSSAISSGTFETFDNSPAFTFTPTISGNYKVYCSLPLEMDSSIESIAVSRIFNTSANATLLSESQASVGVPGATNYNLASVYCQSTYALVAGTTYVFDIQGYVSGATSTTVDGSISSFYMFAEGIALLAPTQGSSVGALLAMTSSPVLGSGAIVPYDTVVFDTNSGYNIGTSTYTIPYSGFYEITATGTMTISSNLILVKNSSQILLLCTLFSGQCSSGSATIQANAGDTIQILSTTAGTVDGSSAPYQNFLSIAQIPVPNLDRAITFKQSAAGGESPGANIPIIFATVNYDTASGFNAGTGQYTVQSGNGGFWRIGGTVQVNSSPPGNMFVTVNGTSIGYIMTPGSTGNDGNLTSGWTETFLNDGDVVTWQTDTNMSFDSTSYLIMTRIGS